MLAFIDDGYTESGFISESPRLYPAVRFTYRPMLYDERARVSRVADASGSTIAIAEAIQNHLVDWDIVDAVGKNFPISSTNIRRLRPELFMAIYAVISGVMPSDKDESQPESPDSLAAMARSQKSIPIRELEVTTAKN